MKWPELRVRISEGRRVFTTVELDGVQIPVTRLAFDTGDLNARDSGFVTVRMEFYADLVVEGDVPLAVTNVEKVRT